MRRLVVYQALARLFGPRQPGRSAKFSGFSDRALASLKDLGVTHVWATGLPRHARADTDPPELVKGQAGSPYAVTDWYDLDDDLADRPADRHAEFDALVARLHGAGLGLIMDFVPNHVARTYRGDLGRHDDPSQAFSPTNAFYYLPGEDLQLPLGNGGYREAPARATGNDVFSARPGVNDWYDTVKLNYGVDVLGGGATHFTPVPPTWTALRDVLVHWAERGVDGFRCDMAELVPLEFWAWLSAELKTRHPHLVLIAEVYNQDRYRAFHEQGGFDLLYDKVGLYDAQRFAWQGWQGTLGILGAFVRHEALQEHLLHFVENHDEPRAASAAFAGSAQRAWVAFALSCLIGRGSVLLYFGQELGEAADPGGRTSIYDLVAVPRHEDWVNGGRFDVTGLSPDQRDLRDRYRTVLRLCQTDPVLREGSTRFVDSGSARSIEWVREAGGERRHYRADLDAGTLTGPGLDF